MSGFEAELTKIAGNQERNKVEAMNSIIQQARIAGYTDVEINTDKPWGAYVRFASDDADKFVTEFFPGMTGEDARMGIQGAELSPKIILVSPRQRLSLQKHARRAERWKFLTEGAYYKSKTDDAGEIQYAKPGEVVQFEKGETHRLCGLNHGYVAVAEIWQHTDSSQVSDEDDIVRLQDDYKR